MYMDLAIPKQRTAMRPAKTANAALLPRRRRYFFYTEKGVRSLFLARTRTAPSAPVHKKFGRRVRGTEHLALSTWHYVLSPELFLWVRDTLGGSVGGAGGPVAGPSLILADPLGPQA